MPVLPLVGSMSTVLPGWIFPSRSASAIMLTPMRSFTLAQRILALELGHDFGDATLSDFIQPHQRRVANQLRDIFCDFHNRFPISKNALRGRL